MSGTFGRDADSVDYWKDEAERYHDHVGASRSAYHDGRLGTATRLLEQADLPAGARIVDFGCGDGVYSRELAAKGFTVTGLDLVEEMVVLAREQDPEGTVTFSTGGAAQLASAGACDAVVSLNVLAYLTDGELRDFWDALGEILAPGGILLVSHSNELFDLFALNTGTAGFFARNFDVDVNELLAAAGAPSAGYNVRANPLTYREELAAHSFEEIGRAYFNFHPAPPALLGEGDAGRILDPDEIARVPEWKQQFQCSTLFSLARRT
jgi:2-polyprenyl-3-methyl-5-hydroxy-6-metoxy-1,4-benzoquinol methylase